MKKSEMYNEKLLMETKLKIYSSMMELCRLTMDDEVSIKRMNIIKEWFNKTFDDEWVKS